MLILVDVLPAGAQDAPELSGDEVPLSEPAPEGPAEETEGEDFSFEDDFDAEFEAEFDQGSARGIYDPLRGYNRLMTHANDRFYTWFLRPGAKGYRKVVPQGVRRSVNRFFQNLEFPIRFVNNILQLKLKEAGVELTRFTVNTTLGLGGFGDPAGKWFGLKAYPEDFGQTLGHYGVGSGFYFVLPVWGPSNLRDSMGLGTDFFLDPICYLGSCYAGYWEAAYGVRSYKNLNLVSLRLGEYESLKKDALDFYLFLRDAYEDSRKKEIGQ